MKLASRQYRIGRGQEYARIKYLRDKGIAWKGIRFYASKGPTDIWLVGPDGVYWEEQIKYATGRKPYISKEELKRLKKYADSAPFKVFLVTKQRGENWTLKVI